MSSNIISREKLTSLEKNLSSILLSYGDLLREQWHVDKSFKLKEQFEPVTRIDVEIEKNMRKKLNELFPKAGFILEEEADEKQTDYNWAIDPIDGTKNFIGNLPLFYTQAALLYKDQPIVGGIYNPISNQLFSASKGNGTRLNGVPLQAKPERPFQQCVIDVDLGNYDHGLSWKLPIFEEIATQCNRIRVTGAAFSPYLAVGAIDAIVVLNERTKIVDQTPRMILMRELGMKYEYLETKEKILVAARPGLFEQLSFLITNLSKR